MNKILSILAILAAVVLTSSCQKDLPDNMKNVSVNKGGQTSTPPPTPIPTPENPTERSDIPVEEDNPWPVY